MKFLNKFWLVAVVSVGLFSCDDSGVKTELAACEAKVDSLESSIEFERCSGICESDKNFFDDEKFISYPVGDGSKDGDHNITVYREAGVAKLSVIKCNLGQPATIIKTIDLTTTQRAIVKVVNGSFTADPTTTPHYGLSETVAFSYKSDMKITLNCPYPIANPVGVAIVGVEDARDGVYLNKGDHNIYPMTTDAHVIIIGKAGNSTLKISRTPSVLPQFYSYLDYCDSNANSTTGVKHWGKNFEFSCR